MPPTPDQSPLEAARAHLASLRDAPLDVIEAARLAVERAERAEQMAAAQGDPAAAAQARQDAFAGSVGPQGQEGPQAPPTPALGGAAPQRGRLARAAAWVRQKVVNRYASLQGQYGTAGAVATLGAMGLMTPIPLPGTSLIPLVVAKGIKTIIDRRRARQAAFAAAQRAAQPAGTDPAAQMAAAGAPAPPGGAAPPAPAPAAAATPGTAPRTVGYGSYAVPVDRPFALPAGTMPGSSMAKHLEALHAAAQPPEVRQRKELLTELENEAAAAEKATERAKALSAAYATPEGTQAIKRRQASLREAQREEEKAARARRVAEVGPFAAGLERLGENLGKLNEGLKGLASVSGSVFAGMAGGIYGLVRASSSPFADTLALSFQRLAGAMGEGFLPIVKDISGWLQRAADWINALDAGLKSNVAKWVAWGAAIAGGVFVISKLGAAVYALVLPAFTALKAAVVGATALMSTFIANPFVAAIAGLALVVGGLAAAFLGVKAAAGAAGSAVEGFGKKRPGARLTPEEEEEHRKREEERRASIVERMKGLPAEQRERIEKARAAGPEKLLEELSKAQKEIEAAVEKARAGRLPSILEAQEELKKLGPRPTLPIGPEAGGGGLERFRKAADAYDERLGKLLEKVGYRGVQEEEEAKAEFRRVSPLPSQEQREAFEKRTGFKSVGYLSPEEHLRRAVESPRTKEITTLEERQKFLQDLVGDAKKTGPGGSQDTQMALRGVFQPSIMTAAQMSEAIQLRAIGGGLEETTLQETLRRLVDSLGKRDVVPEKLDKVVDAIKELTPRYKSGR